MQLRTIQPHPEVAPWIHHFWVFESKNGLPQRDLRVVVPNGRHKLIVPFRNGLTVTGAGVTQHHGEGDIVVVGLWEEPSTLSSREEETCTIGVEFLPHGLSRFVGGELHELSQRVISIGDALGKLGRELRARISGAESVDEAVGLVQAFLLERVRKNAAIVVTPVDAAMQLLQQSGFQMEINELERRMGYSRRHLHALFMRQVGLPPKRLMGVLAFERLYRRFSQNKSAELLREDALEIFYDQSHFIRSFRRFTGFAPGKFAELDNEFGRIFYRSQNPSTSQTYNP